MISPNLTQKLDGYTPTSDISKLYEVNLKKSRSVAQSQQVFEFNSNSNHINSNMMNSNIISKLLNYAKNLENELKHAKSILSKSDSSNGYDVNFGKSIDLHKRVSVVSLGILLLTTNLILFLTIHL